MLEANSFSETSKAAEPSRIPGMAFRLFGDPQVPELHILPSATAAHSQTDHTRRFRIRREGTGDGRVDSLRVQDARAEAVYLVVHSKFLDVHRQCDLIPPTPETFDVADAPLEELSIGLLRSKEDPSNNSRATRFAVAMLCERLKSLLGHHQQEFDSRRLQAWQITAIEGFLSGTLDGTIAVSDAASLCRLSVCQFSRLFKTTYGTPFHRFLLRERVNRAMHRLTESEASLSDIALECGFSDQSCFTRRFSMATGTSPGVWRKRAKHMATHKSHLLHTDSTCDHRQA